MTPTRTSVGFWLAALWLSVEASRCYASFGPAVQQQHHNPREPKRQGLGNGEIGDIGY